jgi:hypothetical protein
VGGEAFSVDASVIEADVDPAKRVPGDEPIAWPERDKDSRAVRDCLSALDRENAETPAGGGTRKPRMAISLTDTEAAWAAYRKMRSIFAHHANYPIDNKLGIIVDAEGNRANRIEENRAAVRMVERVAARFGLTRAMKCCSPPPRRTSASWRSTPQDRRQSQNPPEMKQETKITNRTAPIPHRP